MQTDWYEVVSKLDLRELNRLGQAVTTEKAKRFLPAPTQDEIDMFKKQASDGYSAYRRRAGGSIHDAYYAFKAAIKKS